MYEREKEEMNTCYASYIYFSDTDDYTQILFEFSNFYLH